MSETAKNDAANNGGVQKHNHLATAEMSAEGNYNQIDGIINNEKPSILEHLRQFKPLPNERGGKPEKSAEREK